MTPAHLTLAAVAALAAAGAAKKRGSRGHQHPNWPNWTAQDAAEAGESHEGNNDPWDVDADSLEWRYERAYPVAKLADLMSTGTTKADWEAWLKEEDEYRTEMSAPLNAPPDWSWRKSFTKWWLSDPTVEPIVIVEDKRGRAEGIWDGWHRTAVSVTEGQSQVPVFVGRRKT
jgi:hypothetical protein